MKITHLVIASTTLAASLAIPTLLGQTQSLAASTAPPPPAAPKGTCKTFGAGKCCSPDITMHLSKEAVFSACGESEATFLGEAASKDMFTCKYYFKVAGASSDENYVQVYMNPSKEVPDRPTDPFFSYRKVGKVWMTDRAKSPKAAAMSNATTGLYRAGKGYYVMVSASTKVCTKHEVVRLARSLK